MSKMFWLVFLLMLAMVFVSIEARADSFQGLACDAETDMEEIVVGFAESEQRGDLAIEKHLANGVCHWVQLDPIYVVSKGKHFSKNGVGVQIVGISWERQGEVVYFVLVDYKDDSI